MYSLQIVSINASFDGFQSARIYGSDGVLGFCLQGIFDGGVQITCINQSMQCEYTLFSDWNRCFEVVSVSNKNCEIMYGHVADNFLLCFPFSSYVPAYEHAYQVYDNGWYWTVDEIFNVFENTLNAGISESNACAYFAFSVFINLFNLRAHIVSGQFERDLTCYDKVTLLSDVGRILRNRCGRMLCTESGSKVDIFRLKSLLASGYALVLNFGDGVDFDVIDGENFLLDSWHMVLLIPEVHGHVIMIDTINGFSEVTLSQLQRFCQSWKYSARDFVVAGARRGDRMVSYDELISFVRRVDGVRFKDLNNGVEFTSEQQFRQLSSGVMNTDVRSAAFVSDVTAFLYDNQSVLSVDGAALHVDANTFQRAVDIVDSGAQMNEERVYKSFPDLHDLKLRAKKSQILSDDNARYSIFCNHDSVEQNNDFDDVSVDWEFG